MAFVEPTRASYQLPWGLLPARRCFSPPTKLWRRPSPELKDVSFSLVGDVDWSWPNQNVQDQESSEISICVQAYVYVYKDWLPQSLTTWKFIFWQTHGFWYWDHQPGAIQSLSVYTVEGDENHVRRGDGILKGCCFLPVARWREIIQRQHGWMLHGADFRHVSNQLKRVRRS